LATGNGSATTGLPPAAAVLIVSDRGKIRARRVKACGKRVRCPRRDARTACAVTDRRRVPSLVGALDVPVRAAHRLAPGPAGAVAGGSASTTTPAVRDRAAVARSGLAP
jgi:hypothetical protein